MQRQTDIAHFSRGAKSIAAYADIRLNKRIWRRDFD
jgi:hypothetical protein